METTQPIPCILIGSHANLEEVYACDECDAFYDPANHPEIGEELYPEWMED